MNTFRCAYEFPILRADRKGLWRVLKAFILRRDIMFCNELLEITLHSTAYKVELCGVQMGRIEPKDDSELLKKWRQEEHGG